MEAKRCLATHLCPSHDRRRVGIFFGACTSVSDTFTIFHAIDIRELCGGARRPGQRGGSGGRRPCGGTAAGRGPVGLAAAVGDPAG
ncbi:hypothetical protein [Oryza sativa Japonica Group]|uniref:Uncharacterized protein n=1 Tax=Oryza sativa subsp. japonica TaxID=39947 RepID=Q5N9T3_ORYSJ|nr:hypothetical protein [Oryza sativa Japonica Group]